MRGFDPFVIVAALLVAGVPLAAQIAVPSAGRPPLDPSAQTIPVGFTPDDAEVVFRELSPPPKDEFETTAQYEARVGKRQVRTWYAFTLAAETDFKYDADQEQFSA